MLSLREAVPVQFDPLLHGSTGNLFQPHHRPRAILGVQVAAHPLSLQLLRTHQRCPGTGKRIDDQIALVGRSDDELSDQFFRLLRRMGRLFRHPVAGHGNLKDILGLRALRMRLPVFTARLAAAVLARFRLRMNGIFQRVPSVRNPHVVDVERRSSGSCDSAKWTRANVPNPW